MWGYCASKPRLPGAGYDYNESDMEAANARRLAGTVAVLEYYPACGDLPLRLSENIARRYGGAIYYDSCFRLESFCFMQGIGPLSSSRAVLLNSNRASAGGSVYVDCKDMGLCAKVFAETNTIGVLPLLPKVEFKGSTSSAYGDSIATKPIRIEWHQKDNSSIALVPGQQPFAFVLKLFDSVGNGSLVIGSEDIIEVLICPVTGIADVCTLSSASIPAINQGFDPITGLSNIQADLECAIGQNEMSFQIRVVGAEYIEKITGRIVCKYCDTGQRRVVYDDRGTWDCETCGPDTYNAKHVSSAESGLCLACPPSGTCINGAPPMFGASKMTGVIALELLQGSNKDYVTRSALAAKLGVEAWTIVLSQKVLKQLEPTAQNITFELFTQTEQMAELAIRLTTVGTLLGETQVVSPLLALGEVWEEVVGLYAVFRLQSCPFGNYVFPPGDISIMAIQGCEPCGKGEECTASTCVTCNPCQPGHYKGAVSSDSCAQCPANRYGKEEGATDLVKCTRCPDFAGTKDTGQMSIDACVCQQNYYSTQTENESTFICESCPTGGVCVDFTCGLRKSTWKTNGCAKGSIVGEWERDPADNTWTLVSCPTGHILQNITKDLQKCHKCKEGYYIADSKYCSSTFDCSLATCTKCPKLPARCPGGGPPLFDSKAVTSSVCLHVYVWIQSCYHFC